MLLPLCFSLLLSVGCRAVGSTPRPLLHAQPSAEALAQTVLKALATQDDQALKNLVLTKEEFCQQVWPELPSSQINNLTCDWVWGSFAANDVAGRKQILSVHGGKPYNLIRLRYAKGTTEYKNFKVHEDARVVVQDSRDGQEKELRLFGSILEYDGQFKLFSYIMD